MNVRRRHSATCASDPSRRRAGRWPLARVVTLTLVVTLALALPSALAQQPAQPFTGAPEANDDAIDARYEAVLRDLVAAPAGRAFLEALMLIEREYLYGVDTEMLLRGATQGLVAALNDPYSRYVDPDTVAARQDGEPAAALVDKVMLGDVGYVRISSFQDDAVGLFTGRAIDAHLANGARAFVLDLRGNAGGPVLQGLQVLDRFLSDGVLGFRRVRGVSVPIAYANPRALSQPLVVLVDAATASTAEIVAGALQAYGRAQLVGTITAGKGIGQTAIELSDGAELQLVSFEWLLPGFRTIDGSGLRPDVEVPETAPLDDPVERRVFGLQDVVDDVGLATALRLLREAIGDDLEVPVTKPAPDPNVGPQVVDVPDAVGAPDTEEEAAPEGPPAPDAPSVDVAPTAAPEADDASGAPEGEGGDSSGLPEDEVDDPSGPVEDEADEPSGGQHGGDGAEPMDHDGSASEPR